MLHTQGWCTNIHSLFAKQNLSVQMDHKVLQWFDLVGHGDKRNSHQEATNHNHYLKD